MILNNRNILLIASCTNKDNINPQLCMLINDTVSINLSV